MRPSFRRLVADRPTSSLSYENVLVGWWGGGLGGPKRGCRLEEWAIYGQAEEKRDGGRERRERNEEKMGEAQMTSRQSGMRRQGKKKSALVVGWLWRVGALLGSCAGVGRAALLVRGI